MVGTRKMAAFGAGMAAEYLFDPQQGKRGVSRVVNLLHLPSEAAPDAS